MSERWRCFVAVALGEDLRTRLADAIAGWRVDPRTEGLRWVDPAALHLTLAFLGDVDPADVPRFERALTTVADGRRAFEVPTGRLGAFARSGSARVLWYAIGDPDGKLGRLAGAVAGALGVDDGEPFRPHVTLARARRRAVDLRGWIEPASLESPMGRLSVAGMELIRSHLGSGPARYETLASVPLTTQT